MNEIVFDDRNPAETSAFLTANGRTGVAILWHTGDGNRWGWRIAGDVHYERSESETLASACEDAAVKLADLLRADRPLSYRRGDTVAVVPPVARHHFRVETDGRPAQRSIPIPPHGATMLHLRADGDPVRDDMRQLGYVRDWGGGTVTVMVERDLVGYPPNGTPVWVAAAAVAGPHDPSNEDDTDDGRLRHWPGDGPDEWREPNELTVRSAHESVHLTGEEADRYSAGVRARIGRASAGVFGTGAAGETGGLKGNGGSAGSTAATPPHVFRGEGTIQFGSDMPPADDPDAGIGTRPVAVSPRWVRWLREAWSAWRP